MEESMKKFRMLKKEKMKRRTKTLALVEIAVVLCSMLLVATLPAIATTTSEEDSHPLGIYGNANEDDTIDMRDTTYIKLAIFGKKPKTDLADANHDEKVSMLDVGQTKLIILGKEKQLTLIDDLGRVVTVPMPVERIIALYNEDAIRALGAKDRIVGIGSSTKKKTVYYPEISKKPGIGSGSEANFEIIVELEPDAVIGGGIFLPVDEWEEHLKGTDIVIVSLYPRNARVFDDYPYWPSVRGNMIKLGYVLGEVENAREYVEWYDSILERLDERVSAIPEDEKTRAFLEDQGGGVTERKVSPHIMGCEEAGGVNIVGSSPLHGRMAEVEWIIEQNPDVYIGRSGTGGYKTDDESEFKGYYEEILGLPGYDQIKAVQDSRVHIISGDLTLKLGIPMGIAYMAKWYYPELFEDMDPQEIHQEFVDRFCPGLDFDVRTQGVFVYPKSA